MGLLGNKDSDGTDKTPTATTSVFIVFRVHGDTHINGHVVTAGSLKAVLNREGDVIDTDVVWSIKASPLGSAATLTKTSTDWANPTANFTPDSGCTGTR